MEEAPGKAGPGPKLSAWCRAQLDRAGLTGRVVERPGDARRVCLDLLAERAGPGGAELRLYAQRGHVTRPDLEDLLQRLSGARARGEAVPTRVVYLGRSGYDLAAHFFARRHGIELGLDMPINGEQVLDPPPSSDSAGVAALSDADPALAPTMLLLGLALLWATLFLSLNSSLCGPISSSPIGGVVLRL